MTCKCEKKIKKPRYIFLDKIIRATFRRGRNEELVKDLDNAVVDINNPCSCDVPFCGKYYGLSEDGTRKFRLVFPDTGTTITLQEVNPDTCIDLT